MDWNTNLKKSYDMYRGIIIQKYNYISEYIKFR